MFQVMSRIPGSVFSVIKNSDRSPTPLVAGASEQTGCRCFEYFQSLISYLVVDLRNFLGALLIVGAFATANGHASDNSPNDGALYYNGCYYLGPWFRWSDSPVWVGESPATSTTSTFKTQTSSPALAQLIPLSQTLTMIARLRAF